MKPLFLCINTINSEIGAERVAAHLDVSTSRVYKYGQDSENGSGENIPVQQLYKLLDLTNDAGKEAVRQAAIEIVRSFAERCGVKVFDAQIIDEFEQLVHALKNGNGRKPQEVASFCDGCGEAVQLIKICHTCRRTGATG